MSNTSNRELGNGSENPRSKRDNVIGEFFRQLGQTTEEKRQAVALAIPALKRLCTEVLTQRSGQPYKVRDLLYSLYNGQPTSLLEVVGLDWAIRKDLCLVILAFGHEENRLTRQSHPGEAMPDFFYAAMKEAITAAGQWDWFIEAHRESEVAA